MGFTEYIGGEGALTLITKDGIAVSHGTKIGNNLYKMDVKISEPNAVFTKEANPQCFVINEPPQSWETWHKRFGHIGYGGLQYMLDKCYGARRYNVAERNCKDVE